MLLGVTPQRAGLYNVNTEQIHPGVSFLALVPKSGGCCVRKHPKSTFIFTFLKAHGDARRLSLTDAGTQRITGLRASQYNRMEVRAFPFRFVFCAYAYESRLLTVSPVPKTITSYSSSMLYHRLSRLALFRLEM